MLKLLRANKTYKNSKKKKKIGKNDEINTPARACCSPAASAASHYQRSLPRNATSLPSPAIPQAPTRQGYNNKNEK
jgi:hypothetical protein